MESTHLSHPTLGVTPGKKICCVMAPHGSKCLQSRDQTEIDEEPECLHHLEDNFRKREHLESLDRRDS